MSDSTVPAAALAPPATAEPSPDQLLELYHALLLPRVIEEKMLLLLRLGRLSKWFSGIGQEAIAVGVAVALRPDDALLPMHRNLGAFTSRGVDLPRLLRQLLGKQGGFTKGRDRTFHFGHLERHVVGMISHLGAMLPVADGLALAYKLRGEQREERQRQRRLPVQWGGPQGRHHRGWERAELQRHGGAGGHRGCGTGAQRFLGENPGGRAGALLHVGKWHEERAHRPWRGELPGHVRR